MKTYSEIIQGSEEWFALRCGSIGGSSIATVVAKGRKKGEPSVGKKKLMCAFAGEILSGQKAESYSNHHMERGIEQEDDARTLYEFMTGNEVIQIGLCKP